jgi:SAM-dependent methyltransferase
MRYAFVGSGPGVQTHDGCSVEFYRRLPYMDELSAIESELRRHPDVLELGCGTGRLCRRMLELGLRVAGVDESADMLACMPDEAERIQGSIEHLDLGRKWSAVVLPSHMIHHPDADTRLRFVRAARAHTADGGNFYVSCYPPRWLEVVQEGPLAVNVGIRMFAENVSRAGDLVSMTIRYKMQENEWTHAATAAVLTRSEIEALLASAGFSKARWFESSHLWVGASAGDA